MKKVDLNKKYKTRDGRDVRLAGINEDAHPAYQLLGWVCNGEDWEDCSWSITGSYWGDDQTPNAYDLVEIEEPKPGELWQDEDGNNIIVVRWKHLDYVGFMREDGAVIHIANTDTSKWKRLYPTE